jgi:hypothetical protein
MKYIISALCLFVLVGCSEYEHKFQKGDCVLMKLDGRKGMVLGTRFSDGFLLVRFASDVEVTTSTLFGGARPIEVEPYAAIFVREFELASCES